jgi:anaerobic selenocysteine-containing dehydrogenase
MIYNTVCPRNCYSTCSMKVKVENGRITDIWAHPDNKATACGVCLKGLSYVERAFAKDRILSPLRRKKNGNGFEKISWENALNEIAAELHLLKNKYGPHSVLFYQASGMSGLLNGFSKSFWKLFGGATTTYGNLCWPAGLEATRLTLGECNHNAPWDLENSRLIIMWGKNAAETNIQEMTHVQKAMDKGAHLIVIDPRRTPTSERAMMLYQIKPGTDAALALGIANILIAENKTDNAFIEKYVLGFEDFKAHVAQFTPDKVAKITEIPEKFIHKLAELIGKTRPMTILPGYGMQRYSNGGQTTRAILALQIITGNIGKPGACWHYANLQSYIFDKVKEPLCYFPNKETDSPFRREISTAKLGEDMLKLQDPPLKMAWIERGNPITQNPDTNKTIEAFKKLDFIVVSEQFMTDTAQMANIILPAKNMFEQADLVGSYWNPYIQLRQKIVEPAGEVKPETEVYYLLAKKLNINDGLIAQNLLEPGDTAVENYLKNCLAKFPSVSWEKLKEGPVLEASYQEIAFADFNFPTPSGKIELYSEQAAQLWNVNPLPDYLEPIESRTEENQKYPLNLLTPNCKNRIHSQFNNLEMIRSLNPAPELHVHPYDAMQRNIRHGDKVLLFNDRGKLEIRVAINIGLKKGCVSLSNGWWISQGGTPNFLSLGRETDMGHGAAFHDNMVEIKLLK